MRPFSFGILFLRLFCEKLTMVKNSTPYQYSQVKAIKSLFKRGFFLSMSRLQSLSGYSRSKCYTLVSELKSLGVIYKNHHGQYRITSWGVLLEMYPEWKQLKKVGANSYAEGVVLAEMQRQERVRQLKLEGPKELRKKLCRKYGLTETIRFVLDDLAHRIGISRNSLSMAIKSLEQRKRILVKRFSAKKMHVSQLPDTARNFAFMYEDRSDYVFYRKANEYKLLS
jgi:DNA-binding transcriptional regulator GbsR (MarR family)